MNSVSLEKPKHINMIKIVRNIYLCDSIFAFSISLVSCVYVLLCKNGSLSQLFRNLGDFLV